MSKTKSVISLVLRIVVGVLFIKMGYDKVSAMAVTVANFGQIGITPFFAYAVAWLELVGGVLVLVGFYTKKVAAVLAIIMIGAMYYMFGWLPLVTFVALCVLMYLGCGAYSVGGMLMKSDAAVPPTPAATV